MRRRFLYDFVRRHISLVVLVLAGVSHFCLTIYLRANLSAVSFGHVSMFFTVLAMMWSFGLLGSEQSFLRHARLVNSTQIAISPQLIRYLITSALVGAIGFSISLYHYAPLGRWSLAYLPFSLSLLFVLFLYNYFRLRQTFFWSQCYAGAWKLLLPLVLIPLARFQEISYEAVVLSVMVIVGCAAGIGFIHVRTSAKPVVDRCQQPALLSLTAQFLISLLLLSILETADRLLVEHLFGIVVAGTYFYYLSVALFPFSFLQSYLGFRELPAFKGSFTLALVHRKLCGALMLGIALGLVILLLVVCADKFAVLPRRVALDDHALLYPLIATGLIRVLYSILSAAMGARAEARIIWRINISTMVGLLALAVGLLIFRSLVTPVLVAYAFFLIYVFRAIVSYWGLRCSVKDATL